MKNFRKKQMRLAVLMEITDKPKRNGEIIKGAESRLILDDEFNRLMKNGKHTIGSKELQFILYYIKRDKITDMPDRGLYAESETTVKERLGAASEFIEYVDNEATPEDTFILNPDTLNEVRNLIKGISVDKSKSPKCTETEKKDVADNKKAADNLQVEKEEKTVDFEKSNGININSRKANSKNKKNTAVIQVD